MEKKPTFFWQALLILLPMILLVGIGAYSIRQDKVLAEAEAKERAQSYADDLQRKVSGLLAGLAPDALHQISTNSTEFPTFTVSTNGELLSPAPVAQLMPSTLPVDQLTRRQAELWQRAITNEFSTNRALAITAYRYFLVAQPPVQFLARASYALGLLLGNSDEARNLLSNVATMTFQTGSNTLLSVPTLTNTTSDAGLPLALLAKIKLSDLDFASTNVIKAEAYSRLNSLCEEVVTHPTVLTASVLDFAEDLQNSRAASPLTHLPQWGPVASHARKRWQVDESARSLFVAAKKEAITLAPHFFWIDADQPYLAIAHRFSKTEVGTPWVVSPNTAQVICIPKQHVESAISEILTSASYIPDYFGVSVMLAGRDVGYLHTQPWHEKSYFSPRSPGEVVKIELDATPTPTPVMASNGVDADVKINVVLTNKNALFARQHQRTTWFVFLIVASGAAGGTGLWRSWRTFLRQQQLNEMKSNFVSSVSHELRAPIASVRLLAEALDRGAVAEQPKQKEYFRFIVQECRRLTGLIENVLDFSRIEQGRKQYHFEETDLSALIDQTVKLMQPSATERGVRLELQMADCELRIDCDGLAVQQALVNLIDNAIKHSPVGEAVVVATEPIRNRQPAIRNSILLSVTDHGPGIPTEEHQKIFERFYRRGSELRRETQGIGIGLTIVKHVAEAHGGRVSVESEVGTGSTFTIELPVTSSELK